MNARLCEVESGILEGAAGCNPAFTVYRGIPYAAPPIGHLRWSPPLPPERWAGTRKADAFGPASFQAPQAPGSFYQKEFFPVAQPMSEDCLRLNVWTPTRGVGERLPVMFWIHGGGYMGGYGNEMEFDGEGFCKRGVILVTVNYRLGALGFMVHPELSAESDAGASGNYGLMDLVAALRWVGRNIESFGGDPGNVTIFGQSAGAGCVHCLSVSPAAAGLFHKAIMMSGGGVGSLGRRATLPEAEREGLSLQEHAGASSLAALRSLDPGRLTEAAMKRMSMGASPPRWVFSPIVDGCVLPEDPSDMVIAGRHRDIPYMLGSAKDEFTVMGPPTPVTLARFTEMIRPRFGENAERYLRASGIDTDAKATEQAVRDFADNLRAGHRAWAALAAEQGKRLPYLYYFDRQVPGEDSEFFGAFHSSELWYVFGTLARSPRPFRGMDYDLSLAMGDYWANFARTGNPNSASLPAWTPYAADNPLTMELGESMGMRRIGEDAKTGFLKAFFLKRLPGQNGDAGVQRVIQRLGDIRAAWEEDQHDARA